MGRVFGRTVYRHLPDAVYQTRTAAGAVCLINIALLAVVTFAKGEAAIYTPWRFPFHVHHVPTIFSMGIAGPGKGNQDCFILYCMASAAPSSADYGTDLDATGEISSWPTSSPCFVLSSSRSLPINSETCLPPRLPRTDHETILPGTDLKDEAHLIAAMNEEYHKRYGRRSCRYPRQRHHAMEIYRTGNRLS